MDITRSLARSLVHARTHTGPSLSQEFQERRAACGREKEGKDTARLGKVRALAPRRNEAELME